MRRRDPDDFSRCGQLRCVAIGVIDSAIFLGEQEPGIYTMDDVVESRI